MTTAKIIEHPTLTARRVQKEKANRIQKSADAMYSAVAGAIETVEHMRTNQAEHPDPEAVNILSILSVSLRVNTTWLKQMFEEMGYRVPE
jgi:hypothetical protein